MGGVRSSGIRSGGAGRGVAGAHRRDTPRPDSFTRCVADYAAQRPGQPVAVLSAGCTTAGDDLDLRWLHANGCDITVSLVDTDHKACRAAAAARPELAAAALGDLRTIPLAQRSADVVHCSLLLHRISNSELVLDRFVATLKPGGLLLLRTRDAGSAAGFLDRILPRPARALIWRGLRPGEPGPYPAVYEPLASGHGIQSYVTRRGLVIARRQALDSLAGQPRLAGLRLACRLVAALSRGRLERAHDELRYVIRKPEDRFARVL